MKKFSIVSTLIVLLTLSAHSGVSANAAEIVFCVNKSTRVVTYPISGKCATNSFALNISSNAMNLPKSHTTTAAIAPKSASLKIYIPNVLAMDKNSATLKLTNLGLKVVFKELKKGPKVTVLQVVPKPGSQVAGGSVVTLVVG
jgi:hypothetical protein